MASTLRYRLMYFVEHANTFIGYQVALGDWRKADILKLTCQKGQD